MTHYNVFVTGIAQVSQNVDVVASSESEAKEKAQDLAMCYDGEFEIDNIIDLEESVIKESWEED